MKRTAAFLFATGLALASIGALRDIGMAWVAKTDLPQVLTETSVEVVDRHGQLIGVLPVEDGRWRLAVSVGDVDPRFIDMLVRYEDKRFWSHSGVDPVAILRAGGQAVWHGGVVSGGSTLTMQLARLLENGSTGRWPGKVRQIRLALALEQRFTKDQILSLYLLHAPYGGSLEGIRSASRAWFGKDPKRLTDAEAALLIALPQSPETRRPDRHPETARTARDRVLGRLHGFGVIQAEDLLSAQRSAVPLTMVRFPSVAPHLTRQVAAADPIRLRHEVTLNARVQDAMNRLLQDALIGAPPRVTAAVVVADHQNGDIIASVGSPDFTDTERQGFVDMTRALRSPGSTLKPLVYGLAFDQGLVHPATLIHDGPVQFGRYAPQNFDALFRGDVRVRDALQLSLNIPVIKLTHALGPARIMAGLSRAGVDGRLPAGKPGLAISLGGIGVSLRDLVQLYAAMARGGQAIELSHFPSQQPPAERLMSPASAWHVGHILSGLAPPSGAPANAVAYKTGTSYGHRDAWAIGWDGQHVIGVWVGRADGTPVPGAYGADAAAPILFNAFGKLKPQFATLPPPPAETLLLGASQLPLPLQRFQPRQADLVAADAPELVFPPDGAKLVLSDGGLVLKLRGGQRPYAILANGLPVASDVRAPEIALPHPGIGFSTLTVVDAQGLSNRVTIRVVE